MIARSHSAYRSGRSPYWLKSKNPHVQRCDGRLRKIGAEGADDENACKFIFLLSVAASRQ
jgi:hypothetical protein